MTQLPVSSVTAVRVKPVSVRVTVTVTPGSTAPLSSVTRPLSCAVACAQATPVASSRLSARQETLLKEPFIQILLRKYLCTGDLKPVGTAEITSADETMSRTALVSLHTARSDAQTDSGGIRGE